MLQHREKKNTHWKRLSFEQTTKQSLKRQRGTDFIRGEGEEETRFSNRQVCTFPE